MLLKTYLMILGLPGLVCSTLGDILVTDQFSYPDGALTHVSNGSWKTHSGTAGQVQVKQAQVFLSQRQSEDVNTAFSTGSVDPSKALAVYASFNITFVTLPTGSNGTYFAHFKDGAATTGIRCRIFAATNGTAGGVRLGVAAASNTASSELSSPLVLGSTHRVVCRMMLADNSSSLWIDPREEADPDLSSTDQATPKVAAGFAFRESLASGAGMGEFWVDDLVVATSFAEVVPRAPPPTLFLSLWRDGTDGVQLRWNACPEQSYSVWAADSADSQFELIASQLWFAETFGYYSDACRSPMRIYRVSAD
jgi:hypothetical protein